MTKQTTIVVTGALRVKRLGVSGLNVNVNGISHKLVFHIINGQYKPIIGLKCSVDLGMLKVCVNSMEDQKSKHGNIDSINLRIVLKGSEN